MSKNALDNNSSNDNDNSTPNYTYTDKLKYNEDNQIQSWRETASEPKRNFWQKLFHIKPSRLIATVISRDVHKIDKKAININAIKVCRRLQDNGYEAYIVGGAVRDLILHKNPKDFDVATNATPRCVKKIFSNARIIGRRFKLVHVIFKDCIIETATFRATVEDDERMSDIMKNNVFGTIEEDCMRRDFSINALYYDPIKDVVVDYLGGYRDLFNHKIRVLREVNQSFTEDPVRMIRAVKFSKLLDCSLDAKTIKAIKKHGSLITTCSLARLHEELNKMYRSQKAGIIFSGLVQYNLVQYLISFCTNLDKTNTQSLCTYLQNLDKVMSTNKAMCIEVYWAVILFIALDLANQKITSDAEWELIRANCHTNLNPMRVPNKIIDRAFDIMYFYYLLYNDTTLPVLQKIKKQNISFEIYAFACATGCKPIQNIFVGKIQPPYEQKKHYGYKQKKAKRKVKIQNDNEEDVEQKNKMIKSKKCISTTKKKKNVTKNQEQTQQNIDEQ